MIAKGRRGDFQPLEMTGAIATLCRDTDAEVSALFHVALQHRQQLLEFPPAFRRVLRAFDAMMRVAMNELFGQRFQPATGGNDLRKDFRAVTVFVQHPFHGVELSDDFPNTDN